MWRERAAAQFILTGRSPEPLSVAVGFGQSSRPYVPNTAIVVITANVWVSVDDVAGAFKTAQRQILGGDNRKKKGKSFEVIRFVAGQIREHGARPSWRKLHASWNRSHPESRYKSHSGLRKTFEDFVHPEYNRPKYKGRERKTREGSRELEDGA